MRSQHSLIRDRVASRWLSRRRRTGDPARSRRRFGPAITTTPFWHEIGDSTLSRLIVEALRANTTFACRRGTPRRDARVATTVGVRSRADGHRRRQRAAHVVSRWRRCRASRARCRSRISTTSGSTRRGSSISSVECAAPSTRRRARRVRRAFARGRAGDVSRRKSRGATSSCAVRSGSSPSRCATPTCSGRRSR